MLYEINLRRETSIQGFQFWTEITAFRATVYSESNPEKPDKGSLLKQLKLLDHALRIELKAASWTKQFYKEK